MGKGCLIPAFVLLQKHCERQKSSLRVRFRPSLFQHVGLHSSLAGKIQKLTVSHTPSPVYLRQQLMLPPFVKTLASPFCVSVGQRLPEATAPQDACQPAGRGFHINEGVTPEFQKKNKLSAV